ncbi:hypothetical protein BT69DRAFT_1300948 [Atractiella rhizophila]|nr:hypothetical protein BT69DRAFT_1300948 [Atractiella rhizophila]
MFLTELVQIGSTDSADFPCLLYLSEASIEAQGKIIKIYDPLKDGARVHPPILSLSSQAKTAVSISRKTKLSSSLVLDLQRLITSTKVRNTIELRCRVEGGIQERDDVLYQLEVLMTRLPQPVDCTHQDRACNVQDNRVFQFHQYRATTAKPAFLNIPLQWLVNDSGKNLTYRLRPTFLPLQPSPINVKVGKIIIADRYSDIVDEKAKEHSPAIARRMVAMMNEHKSFPAEDILKGVMGDAKG